MGRRFGAGKALTSLFAADDGTLALSANGDGHSCLYPTAYASDRYALQSCEGSPFETGMASVSALG